MDLHGNWQCMRSGDVYGEVCVLTLGKALEYRYGNLINAGQVCTFRRKFSGRQEEKFWVQD